MAKMGNFFGGGGGTPPILPTGGSGGTGGTPIFSDLGSMMTRGGGGIFPERGSTAQLEAVMAALQGANSGAQQSGSPLLAFLAPMATGAVGTRTQGLYKDAQKGRDDSAIETLLASMGGSGNFNGAPSLFTTSGGAPADEAAPQNAFDSIFPTGKTGPAPAGNIDAASGLSMGSPAGDGVSASLDMIKQFEGYRDSPYWDVNAHRVGYGSDTITMPDGSVRKVKKGDKVNRQLAELDLQRRVTQEFMPKAASKVGADVWRNLNPMQQAALTSVTYNYGSLPSSVAKAARSGNPQATAQAINALGSHNDGVNAGRRAKEASAFMGALQSGDFTTYAHMGQPAPMAKEDMRSLLGLMTNPDVSDSIKGVAQSMLTEAMGNRNGMTAREQIGLAGDMMGLEQAMNPTMSPQEQIRLQQEQIKLQNLMNPEPKPRETMKGADGYTYYKDDGSRVLPNVEKADNSKTTGELAKQYNQAATIIQDAIKFERDVNGLTDEEARTKVMSDPLYQQQLELLQMADEKLKDAGQDPAASAPPPPPGTVPY